MTEKSDTLIAGSKLNLPEFTYDKSLRNTIKCEIEADVEQYDMSFKRANELYRDKLLNDIASMLTKPSINDLMDVVIEVDGKQICAHRFVLAARSPVFVAMFAKNSEMREASESRVVITDVRAEVFEHFLNHLYGNPLGETVLNEYAEELFKVADKVRIIELSKILRRF